MRLTHYDESRKRWQINNDYGAVMIDELNYAVGEAIDKLAAYEDTGVEPEEIEDRQDVCLWIPEDRFAEIINAEAQGRLVILPCKVGTAIWRVWCGKINRYVVVEVDAQDHVKLRFLIECLPYLRFYWDDEYGKTVFLTREDAEAALIGEPEDV